MTRKVFGTYGSVGTALLYASFFDDYPWTIQALSSFKPESLYIHIECRLTSCVFHWFLKEVSK